MLDQHAISKRLVHPESSIVLVRTGESADLVEGKVGPDKYFVAVSMFYTDILVIAFACVFICFLTGPTAAEPVAAIDSGGDTS